MDMNYRGGLWEGGGGQDGVEWGGEWDNCNSIINKYFLKSKKKKYIRFNSEHSCFAGGVTKYRSLQSTVAAPSQMSDVES